MATSQKAHWMLAGKARSLHLVALECPGTKCNHRLLHHVKGMAVHQHNKQETQRRENLSCAVSQGWMWEDPALTAQGSPIDAWPTVIAGSTDLSVIVTLAKGSTYY